MRSVIVTITYTLTFQAAALADCQVPAKSEVLSQVCRLDLEICLGHESTAEKLLDRGVSPFEACRQRHSISAHTAVRATGLKKITDRILKAYIESPLKDPDLVLKDDIEGKTQSLLQAAIEARNSEAVETILLKPNLNINRENSYPVGVGTPPFTALAVARIGDAEANSERQKIINILKRAGANYENCLALVQLNDPDPRGTHLRKNPSASSPVVRTLKPNPKTLLAVVGHQNGWLKVSKIYPETSEDLMELPLVKREDLKQAAWVKASLTRYPDILLPGRAEPGIYAVQSCVTEAVEVIDSKMNHRWLSTYDLVNRM